ncbi:interleukin-13 receptor subunit alpha-1 isoform X2 [Microcaecilia unicolor]|uniref:Interleukin-13 receptor subunit alpha-1 isoform X2 n=1 Tax=Microcaecilia unicolor TaxID=1415580 RepID=A0A6P7YQD3_9AMPH|nr:interleukin-13 receptor subunit alpha-1 isoform X2 [Microcaecilia unicolor]
MSTGQIPPKQQSKRLWRSEYKGSYPNDTACLKVRAGCVKNDLYGLSSWIRNCTLLSKGDPDTSVTKFACVWYNMDYMNCTWQPGKHTPPDTKYVFYYRYEQLNSDRECPKYIFENQTRIGCHFSKDELCEESKIYLMVTDHSESLRSFYTDVDLYSVLKPSTPRITNLSNISDNEIYVSWTNLWLLNNACLCSQVEVKENALDVGTFSVSKDRSLVILRKYFPDVHYTVRVREKVDELCSASLWSDWSQEESLNETSPVKKGEDSNSGSSLIYLLMILFIVGVATIIFLVHLKRLRFLIFPPIPDPAKLFKGMLEEQNGVWQWTKYSEANVSCKPVKEETYSVFLIENPDSSSSEN